MLDVTEISRAVVLYCCKDGTISYEPRNAMGAVAKPFNGVALPVYSVESVEEAKMLQTLCCSLSPVPDKRLPGGQRYTITMPNMKPFSRNVDDLKKVQDILHQMYRRMKK
jgi:hypothetical protein